MSSFRWPLVTWDCRLFHGAPVPKATYPFTSIYLQFATITLKSLCQVMKQIKFIFIGSSLLSDSSNSLCYTVSEIINRTEIGMESDIRLLMMFFLPLKPDLSCAVEVTLDSQGSYVLDANSGKSSQAKMALRWSEKSAWIQSGPSPEATTAYQMPER